MKNMIKRFTENFKKDERGMTLVELLAVVVILGIIGLIAFVSIGNVIENSKEDAHVANAQQIIHAAELYVASGGNVDGTAVTLTGEGAIDTLPDEIVSPWGGDDTSEDYIGGFTLTYTAADNSFKIAHDGDSANGKGIQESTKVELAQGGRDRIE